MKKIAKILTVLCVSLLMAIFITGCNDNSKNQETPTITSIYIASQPTKTVYETGETFNPAGMTVKAVFSDGTEKVVADYSYDLLSPLTTNDNLITVSYNEKTVGLNITVSDPIINEPIKYNFKITCGENGTFTAKKQNVDFSLASGTASTLESGTNIKIAIKANEGYHIKSYSENGTSVSDFIGLENIVSSYIACENYDIAVTFEKNPIKVVVYNGTVQGSSTPSVGDSVTIKANSIDGYVFSNWKIISKNLKISKTTDATLTFVMPNTDSDIIFNAEYAIYQKNTNEITSAFKPYFYDESGNVKLNKLDGFSSAEWAIASNSGLTPLKVFAQITGYEIDETAVSYNYKFVSSDGMSTISINGNTTAGDNAEYATMRISIPSCSEIQTIHIGNTQYFNDSGITALYLELQN